MGKKTLGNKAATVLLASTLALGGAGAIATATALAPTGMTPVAQAATPARANVTKVKATSTSVTVYASAKSAEIYQYRLSTSKSFKKNVRKGASTSAHYKFAKLKKSTRYYVKVRAIADKPGKWSKVVSAKTRSSSKGLGKVVVSGYTLSDFKVSTVTTFGQKCARLSYRWKNTGQSDANELFGSIGQYEVKAYQGGVLLDVYGYNKDSNATIMPGRSLKTYRDYRLRNEKSPVQIIIKTPASMGKVKVLAKATYAI